MKCQRQNDRIEPEACGGRVVKVFAKCSDSFSVETEDEHQEYEGYVPDDMGIGSGDYIDFAYCLDCGQIQGDEFPLAPSVLARKGKK